MSMIMVLENVSAGSNLGRDEAATIPFKASSGHGGLGDDLFAARAASDQSISLEKSWHGLHFLLTGSSWEGTGPEAFLVSGGTEHGEDMGYGPARIFDPTEVRQIAASLNGLSGDSLWSRFDARQMEAADIYPGIWDEDEEDLREEYLEYFAALKTFVSQVAERDDSLKIVMT